MAGYSPCKFSSDWFDESNFYRTKWLDTKMDRWVSNQLVPQSVLPEAQSVSTGSVTTVTVPASVIYQVGYDVSMASNDMTAATVVYNAPITTAGNITPTSIYQAYMNYPIQGSSSLKYECLKKRDYSEWVAQTDTTVNNVTYNPYITYSDMMRYAAQDVRQTQFMVNYLGNWDVEDTEEQKAERAVRQERYAAQAKAEREKREEAEKRAEELLIACLTTEEAQQYLLNGYFETKVNDRVYRIKKGRSGNVELVENGQSKYRYCAHPLIWTPDQDVMLSQLLMLKTDEQRFLKTANRTVLHGS